MSKRSPKSVEEKLELVQLYQEQGVSISTLVSSYGVASTTIKKWIRKYENSGIDGLKESRTWKQYSKELKEQAVQDYLNNLGSLETIIEKYHISSQSVLKRWINQYTSDKALQTTSKGLSRMKQGRKTTFEERVEIVNFTIAHDK
ncbi:TPA: transposase, partial [Streptococcus equi subsp. zooepidemicus]|nr:transposase [Streptococcus equi subsp. zooepidemicus]HEL1135469.1 transposase [Streptococcus equi subsp. zooepidemicus]HEL1314510.1 transposase [Streptococcus equi subsp. zooepidemicus]